MKTRFYFLALVFIGFVFTNAMGQKSTSVDYIGELLNSEYSLDKVNLWEDHVLVAGNDSDYNGLLRLFEKDEQSVSLLQEWTLSPYAPDPSMIIINSSMISPENIFTCYSYGMNGYNSLNRIEMNSVSGENFTRKEFIGGSMGEVINNGSNFYLVFYAGSNYDPLDSGLPAASEIMGKVCILELSGEDLSLLNYRIICEFDNQGLNGMQWTPEGNIAMRIQYGYSDFFEINISSGETRSLRTGGSYDRYSFQNGYLIHFGEGADGGFAIYGGDNYDELLFYQQWEYYTHGNDCRIDQEGNIFSYQGVWLFHNSFNTLISNEIIGEEKIRAMNDDDYLNVVSHRINDNTTVDIVMQEDGWVTMHRITEHGQSLIPTLNDDDPIIHSVYDGQVFNEGWQECSPYLSSMVFYDDSFPSVGESTNESWVNIPEGMELAWMSTEIEEDESGMHFRLACKYIGNYWDYIYLKVILEKKSDVISTNFSQESEKQEGHMFVYPNPAFDQLKIQTSQSIQRVQVYNLTGQLVFSSSNVHPNKMEFDISSLQAGTYLVNIIGRGFSTTEKIIKR
jgi:hypothetical protein